MTETSLPAVSYEYPAFTPDGEVSDVRPTPGEKVKVVTWADDSAEASRSAETDASCAAEDSAAHASELTAELPPNACCSWDAVAFSATATGCSPP